MIGFVASGEGRASRFRNALQQGVEHFPDGNCLTDEQDKLVLRHIVGVAREDEVVLKF